MQLLSLDFMLYIGRESMVFTLTVSFPRAITKWMK